MMCAKGLPRPLAGEPVPDHAGHTVGLQQVRSFRHHAAGIEWCGPATDHIDQRAVARPVRDPDGKGVAAPPRGVCESAIADTGRTRQLSWSATHAEFERLGVEELADSGSELAQNLASKRFGIVLPGTPPSLFSRAAPHWARRDLPVVR